MMAGRVADIEAADDGAAQDTQIAAESMADSRDHERSL